MVLLIKLANLRSTRLWIEDYFHRKYKLRRVKFDRFIVPDVPGPFFTKLKRSKRHHGFMFNGTLYVHPDSYIRIVSQNYQRLIARTLVS